MFQISSAFGSLPHLLFPHFPDLVSSPLTSPLKIIRNPGQQIEKGLAPPPAASLQWRPPGESDSLGVSPSAGIVSSSPRQNEAPKPRRFLPSIDVEAIIRRREAAIIAAAQPPAPPPAPPPQPNMQPYYYGPQPPYPQLYGQAPPPPAMAHYMMQHMMGGTGGGAPDPTVARGKGRGKPSRLAAGKEQSSSYQQPMMNSLPAYGE